MTRPSFKRVLLPALALLGLVAAAFMIFAGQPDRAKTTPVELPSTAPAAQARAGTVSGSGVVEPSSELIEVGAQAAGLVTRVAVQAGDRVGPGQLLLTIDSRDADASIAEARSAVALARARVASASVDLTATQRQLDLYTSISDPRTVAEQQVIDRRSQRDQASARLAVSRAEVDAAKARLSAAQTTAGLREIRSPRSAEVLQVRTRAGQFATAGPGSGNSEPLMILGETRPMHVRIDIDESEIDRAALGEPAAISPRGNARTRVRTTYVRTEPLIVPKRSLTNASTERVDVRVLQLVYALPEDATGYFVGQQVDAYIPAKRASSVKTSSARAISAEAGR